MNTKPAQVLKHNFFPLLLIAITLVLVIVNYSPKTYLSGWDTLHPEFNYRIYWARIIDGVWQEHQGLGAVASQAHPAEIPRILIIMLFDLLLPTSTIRYAYAFLMLILGPLGIYFFMKKGVFASHTNSTKIEIASFLAGLFYLLNLVTLQHFYVPLEMFLTHYGFLGFFMLALIKILQDPSRKNSLIFVLVSFFMAPQAHTSTLFFALVIFVAAFLFVYVTLNRFSPNLLKRSILAMMLLFAVNAFWLLPNLYFIAFHGAQVQESKIQRLFNEEAFLQNNSFGNIKNISVGRGFLFNWGEHDGNLGYKTLMDEWRSYQTNEHVKVVGYTLFACVVLGILAAIKQKNKEALAVLGILFVSLFFLFGVNQPTGFLYTFISDHSKLFKDAFRFNFTKFSISLVFAYSVFFGFFVFSLIGLFEKALYTNKHLKILQLLIMIVFSGLLVIWMQPAFKGFLISPSMRVNIPPQYFDMFDFFDKQEGYGRVADLPINSFWGWVYYDWPNQDYSYQGAGFLWFGIKQPLMNREFDRWNPINQNYYNDMTQAIYSQDVKAVENTLQKYKIRYVLFDSAVVAPGHNQKTLFREEIAKMLKTSEDFSLAQQFGQNLAVYEYLPGEDYKLNEIVTGENQLIQEPENLNNTLELASEELNPKYITSDEKSISINGELSSDSISTMRVPYRVTYEVVDKILKLSFWNDSNNASTPSITNDFVLPAELVGKTITIAVDDSFVSIDTSTFGEVGTFFLTPSTPAKVTVYKETPHEIKLSTLAQSLEICSLEEEYASFEYAQTKDGLVLRGKNADACVSSNLSKLVSLADNKPLTLKLTVTGQFDDIPCVYNIRDGLCKNVPQSVETSFFSIDTGLNNYVLRLFARAFDSEAEVQSIYRGIALFDLEEIDSQEISLKTYGFLASTENLVFNKNKFLGGKLNSITTKTRYCKSGDKFVPLAATDGGKTYKTIKDEICTSIEFPFASHKDAYVLEVRSSFKRGMPQRICVTNEYSKRCDKYVELAKSIDPVTQYYLIPPSGSETGYTINISNLSFGDVLTENSLYSVSLTPVIYELFESAITSENTRPQLTAGEKLFVHNQAFEKNWKLFCGIVPCKAQHVLVNGWANGWILPSSTDFENIRVVFWPQLLEVIGFGVVAIVLFDIVRRKT